MADVLKPAVLKQLVYDQLRDQMFHVAVNSQCIIVCIFCYHYHCGVWSCAWRAIKICDVWPDCGLAICCEIIIAAGLQHICEGCVPTPQNKLFSQVTDLMFDRQYATHVLRCRISTWAASKHTLAQVAAAEQTFFRIDLAEAHHFTLQQDCGLMGPCCP